MIDTSPPSDEELPDIYPIPIAKQMVDKATQTEAEAKVTQPMRKQKTFAEKSTQTEISMCRSMDENKNPKNLVVVINKEPKIDGEDRVEGAFRVITENAISVVEEAIANINERRLPMEKRRELLEQRSKLSDYRGMIKKMQSERGNSAQATEEMKQEALDQIGRELKRKFAEKVSQEVRSFDFKGLNVKFRINDVKLKKND